MKQCTGNAKAGSAADPDWFTQADQQMSDLLGTLLEINDPTCLEAWGTLERALIEAKRMKQQGT